MSSATVTKEPSNKSNPRLMELVKSTYQAEQQVKYLYLQAEIETLLLQQQALKQQRNTVNS